MKKIRLTESQLNSFITESVRRVINEMCGTDEISSDMISRATQKFHQKYGGTDFPGPDAKDFPKDKNGNLLYPKDMKTLADHYRKFRDAHNNANRDEDMNDPLVQQAMQIWNDNQDAVDWDVIDDFENEGVELGGWLEVDGWEFEADAFGYREGGWGDYEIEEIKTVDFTSPDGKKGSFKLGEVVNESRVIKINESGIKKIIAESVKRVLKEMEMPNADNMAKQVFNSINFSEEYLEDTDFDMLSWEPTGEGWYEATDTYTFEKDGWKFKAPVVWTQKTGWYGQEPDWNFYGKTCEIKYMSPDGQTGSFII